MHEIDLSKLLSMTGGWLSEIEFIWSQFLLGEIITGKWLKPAAGATTQKHRKQLLYE